MSGSLTIMMFLLLLYQFLCSMFVFSCLLSVCLICECFCLVCTSGAIVLHAVQLNLCQLVTLNFLPLWHYVIVNLLFFRMYFISSLQCVFPIEVENNLMVGTDFVVNHYGSR